MMENIATVLTLIVILCIAFASHPTATQGRGIWAVWGALIGFVLALLFFTVAEIVGVV